VTRAKFEALRLLAAAPRYTAKCTEGDRIGGRVAAVLIREGLAQRYGSGITITAAGRAALELESPC
jgi:hypothetical protein